MFGNYNSFEQAIGESNENSDKHRMNSHQDSKSNNQDSESSNKGRSEGHPMMQAEAIGTFAQVNFHTIISIFAVIGGMSMIYCAVNFAYEKIYSNAGFKVIEEEC